MTTEERRDFNETLKYGEAWQAQAHEYQIELRFRDEAELNAWIARRVRGVTG